jgi:hypothetical protein
MSVPEVTYTESGQLYQLTFMPEDYHPFRSIDGERGQNDRPIPLTVVSRSMPLPAKQRTVTTILGVGLSLTGSASTAAPA